MSEFNSQMQEIFSDPHLQEVLIPVRERVRNLKNPATSDLEQLSTQLNSLLYRYIYCIKLHKENGTPTGSTDDPVEFVNRLSAANSSRDSWHIHWQLVEKNSNGSILAMKDGNSRLVGNGDYIIMKDYPTDRSGHQWVKIKLRGEWLPDDLAFYFVFSEAFQSEIDETFLRIYWNIAPGGASMLVSKISSYFNRYKIPFQFKVLKAPGLFNRLDTAVIYLERIYFKIAMDIIGLFTPAIQDFLRPETPLFTNKLRDGLAYAENPVGDESFGMNRTRIIGEAILDAMYKGIIEQLWPGHIEEYFAGKGLDPGKPYLNPGSKFYYPKPSFV